MTDWREQFSKTSRSPDDLHGAHFLLVGEIRFGPSVYHVEVDGWRLRKGIVQSRNFGEACLWSPDARYLALTEFRHLIERKGPDTAVVVVDVVRHRQCRVGRNLGGLTDVVAFDGSVLTYTATRWDAASHPSVERIEVDVAAPRRWRPLWW